MWLDPGYREYVKGLAMLTNEGTIALILSDKEGCSSKDGKE